MNLYDKQLKKNSHACVCRGASMQECVRVWVYMGVCVLVDVHVQLPSSSELVCALCGLLAAVHKEYCWRLLGFPHSPPEYKTVTHSVLQITRSTPLISFLRACICTYPTLELGATKNSRLCANEHATKEWLENQNVCVCVTWWLPLYPLINIEE